MAQIAPLLGDVEANRVHHREAIERAHEAGADLVVFPELSLTGYRLKDTVPDVAATQGDDIFEEFALLSKDISIVVGMVEETQLHQFYNAAAYFENGALVTVHRKVYLPTYGMFDEQRYFARGNRVRAFDTKHGRMAILVCEDMQHPTALTVAALDGASIILVPSASPSRGVEKEGEAEAEPKAEVDANGRHWEGYNRALARTLGLYVVHANRVGVEDGQTFWGGSEIVGPDGTVIAKAKYYEDDQISAVLPDSAVRRRRIQAPVLRDEDMDLTINELMRLRGRPREATDRQPARGGRDQPQPGGGEQRGGEQRGGDPRGRGRGRDRRGGDRRRDRRNDGRDNRGGRDRRHGGGGDNRDRRHGGGGDNRDRGGRNFDRQGQEPPRARYRPEPGERERRPLGPEGMLPDLGDEDDQS